MKSKQVGRKRKVADESDLLKPQIVKVENFHDGATEVTYKAKANLKDHNEDPDEVVEFKFLVVKMPGMTQKVFELARNKEMYYTVFYLKEEKKYKPAPTFPYEEEDLNSEGTKLWEFYQRWKDFHGHHREDESDKTLLKRFKRFTKSAKRIYYENRSFCGNKQKFDSPFYDYIKPILPRSFRGPETMEPVLRRIEAAKKLPKFKYSKKDLLEEDVCILYQKWKFFFEIVPTNQLEDDEKYEMFKNCARYFYRYNEYYNAWNTKKKKKFSAVLYYWYPCSPDFVKLPADIHDIPDIEDVASASQFYCTFQSSYKEEPNIEKTDPRDVACRKCPNALRCRAAHSSSTSVANRTTGTRKGREKTPRKRRGDMF